MYFLNFALVIKPNVIFEIHLHRKLFNLHPQYISNLNRVHFGHNLENLDTNCLLFTWLGMTSKLNSHCGHWATNRTLPPAAPEALQ